MTVQQAVAVLRRYALTGIGAQWEITLAIDTLDNADVFVGHDGEEV